MPKSDIPIEMVSNAGVYDLHLPGTLLLVSWSGGIYLKGFDTVDRMNQRVAAMGEECDFNDDGITSDE